MLYGGKPVKCLCLNNPAIFSRPDKYNSVNPVFVNCVLPGQTFKKLGHKGHQRKHKHQPSKLVRFATSKTQ